MFRIFGAAKKIDNRDIEQVIDDVAENHNKVDYKHLYQLLKNKEIFIPVVYSSIPKHKKPGDKYTPDKIKELTLLKSFLGPKNQPLIPAATKNNCAILRSSYVTMDWIDFIVMVQKTEDVEGTLLEGENSWVKLDKQRITHIFNLYKI